MLGRRLNQAGDTIVEVLMATAVLAFVMGAAYSLTIRTLNTSRAAQERVEALKYVEGQLEKLKYEARNRSDFTTAYRTTSQFCFKQTATVETALSSTTDCTAVGSNGRYKLKINYENNSAFADPNKRFGTFNVEAKWDRVGGGQEVLVINYQT